MLPTGASASSFPGYRAVVDRIFRDNLPNTKVANVFRQETARILDRWEEDSTASPTVSQLPALACEAVGGDPGNAVPVAAAWQLIRLAAKLLDDVEDRDIDERLALALNVATSLIFAAPLALNELTSCTAPEIAWQASVTLERAMLRTAAGQHSDLAGAHQQKGPKDPDTWLEIAQAKSGELFAWAGWAGALAGGADEDTQECLRQYGSHAGVLLQVADDFNGIWGNGDVSDLVRGCLSLPVCYARYVLQEQARGHLETLLDQAAQGDRTAEGDAVNILVQSGAQAYLLSVARLQYCQAISALRQVRPPLISNRSLIGLLDGVMPMLASLRA